MLAARQAPDPVAGPGQAALLHDGSTAAVLLELAGSQRVDVVFDGASGELAVVDEGLGAVFFGPPEFADFRAEFGVPEEWTPVLRHMHLLSLNLSVQT